MGIPLLLKWSGARGYVPSAKFAGKASDTIFAGLNMISKGSEEEKYYEQWTGYGMLYTVGANDLLTGTSAINGTNTVTGTGTKYLSELVPGQPISIDSRVYVPMRIDSDISMVVTPKTHTTLSGITVAALQQIQELDTDIISFTRGSIVKMPLGHMLGVGRGVVRKNGSTIAGSGWTLRDQPQLAVLDGGTSNFTIYRLGMRTPTLTTLAAVASGGTKLAAGNYSVRIVPAKVATSGFNNPSGPVAVAVVAGDFIRITFPAMDTNNGQDAWRIYGTLSTSSASAIQGPWFFVRTVTTTEVASGGGTFDLEWADAEISSNDQLEFDNNAPPAAQFVGSIGGLPVLLSCNGKGRPLTGTVATTATSGAVVGTGTLFTQELAIDRFVYINNILRRVTDITDNTNMTVTPVATATAGSLAIRSADETPGPVIRPAKAYLGGYNFDGYPARAAVSVDPPADIIGYLQGERQIFLLTANALHVAEPNLDPSTSERVPVVTRRFWGLGFRNARQLVMANNTLYGFTVNGATRSQTAGDKVETQHEFAAPVASDMALWDPGKVTVGYSAQHEAICYLHADDGTRLGGTSRYGTLLMFKLRSQTWDPPLRIEDLNDINPTYAMSSCTVQNIFYFASPTAAGNTNVYQLEVANGEVGETYLASPFMDAEAEGLDKVIEGIVLTVGRNNSSPVNVAVFGSSATGAVPLSNLKAGIFSASGNLPFTVDTPAVTTERYPTNVQNLRTVSFRVQLATSGNVSGRLDELVADGEIDSVRY